MKFLSNILIKAGLLVEGTTTLSTIANASTDTDRFIVSDSGVIKYRTGSQILSDIGAADDSLVVHKAGSETITGLKTFNLGISLPNYAPILLSNGARIEGYDGKVLFRTVYGTAGYFENNSLYLAQMDNDASTAGIGVLVKTFGTESKVSYKTAAQMLTFIGAQGSLILTTTGSSGAATLVSNTLNIPNYTLSGLGGVPSSRTLTINGTALDLSADRSWSVGTVTSVGLTVPTGFSVSNSPITSSGDIAIAFAAGYSLPTTASQSNWDTAYNNRITSLTTTGSSGPATLVSNTLNIPQYTLAGLGGVPTTRSLTINGTSYDLSADRSWSVGTVTSVGLTMPAAFTVSNSPITGSGNIAVTGAGLASQYVRGDGTLADFPTGGGGGGASVSYYLNGSVNQGTFVGNTYYEFNKTPILGTGTDFTINTNGYIAQFITDAGDPALLKIPGGNWNTEFYFSASSGGGTPTYYIELYKYDGSTFTLIASNSSNPDSITGGTSVEAYFATLAVPETVLTITDRLAIRIYVNSSGRTITLHTEDNNLCQIITTFTTGITALNSLTEQVQYLTTGTSGTDFNISSSVATHTFNIPTASATNRGALSTTDWSTFNNKVGGSGVNTQAAFFTGTNTIAGSSVLILDGSNIAIGQAAAAQKLSVNGDVSITTIINATTDTDRFLVSDGGVIKYRTGAEVLSDIGGQAALTNPVTGTGTTNYLSKFTGSTTLANSQIFDNGSSVGVGTATPSGSYKLDVNGNINVSNAVNYSQGGTKYGWTYATVAAMAVEGLQGAGISFGTGIGAVATERVAIANDGNVTFSVINNATTDTDRFLVSDSGVLKYRTGSEVLSDIGAAASTSISGTTNYIPKFTSSSAIGNSQIFDDGTNVGIGTAAPSGKTEIFGSASGTTFVALSLRNTDEVVGSDASMYFSTGSGALASTNITGLIRSSVTQANPSALKGNLKFYVNSGDNVIEAMQLDASGNLGLGVTPSAFSTYKAFQIGAYSSLVGQHNDTRTWLSNNAYFDGTNWKYIVTAAGVQYNLYDGEHRWFIAPSGTANTNISFTQAMTLDASGLLNVGGTGGTKRLNVFGDSRILNVAPTLDFTLSTNTAFSHSIVASNYSSSPISSNTLEFRVASGASTQATVMTLNGAGNVGIGTISPQNVLDLGATSNGNGLTWSNYSNLFSEYSSGALWMSSNFYGNIGSSGYKTSLTATFGAAAISVSGTSGSGNSGLLQFYVDDAVSKTAGASFTPTERMRITSGGNLGLGVSPSNWASGEAAMQTTYGTFIGNSGLNVGRNIYYNAGWKYIGTGHASLYNQSSGIHTWSTAVSGTAGNAVTFSDNMTLDASGNLGIGTTSNLNLGVTGTIALSVGGSTAYGGIQIRNSTGNLELFVGGATATDALIRNNMNGNLRFGTNGIEQMRITSGGLVGIGTSTTYGILNLQSGTNARWEFSSGASATLELLNNARNAYVDFNVYANNYIFNRLGAESMRIDASGNLGLGVTPAAWRSINKVIQIGNAALWNESNSVTWLGNNTYENSVGQYIYINSAGATAYTQFNGSHIWYNAPSGTAGNAISFTQAMTLNASGNLAVGTPSPSTLKVTIENNGGNLRLRNTTTRYRADFVMNTTELGINSYDDVAASYMPIVIEGSKISLMQGNVGIGTTNPDRLLTVYADNSTTAPIAKIQNAGTGDAVSEYRVTGSSWYVGIDNSDSDKFKIGQDPLGTSDRLTIDGSGNVGIGTTSPSHPLSVQANTGANAISIIGRASDNTGSIDFFQNNGTSRLMEFGVSPSAAEFYYDANSPMIFYTNGTERMRITSGGNVLVGRTTNAAAGWQMAIKDGLTVTDGTYEVQLFGYFGAGVGTFTNHDFTFRTNNTEKMRITSGGNVLIGTTTDAGQKLQVNGVVAAKDNVKITNTNTTSVSTSATTISNVNTTYGAIAIVWGSDVGGNIFTDMLFHSLSSVSVISSQGISGGPAGRTYTMNSGDLRLAMNSGTYTIRYQSIITV